MKLSITLAALALAFTGSVSAAPASDISLEKRNANCNSNGFAYANLPKGYAVLPTYDNNAADIPASIGQGTGILDCITQCAATTGCVASVYSPAGDNWGFCYPKNYRFTAFNVYSNGARVFAAKGSCSGLVAAGTIPAGAPCCDS